MKKLILVFISLALLGCNRSIVKQEYLKNYTIGETKSAYIGEPIVRVRDVLITTSKDSADCYYFSPNNDFIITGEYSNLYSNSPFKIIGSSQTKYAQMDKVKYKDADYSVIAFKDNVGDKVGLLVDVNGNILDKYVYLKTGPTDLIKPALNPNGTKIISSKQSVSCAQENDNLYYVYGSNNFEIIYSGVSNVSLSLAYREYTANDLARPAFSQNLLYETGAKEVRFKTFKIAIIEATNEKIVYKVIEDKLENSIVGSENRR